MQSTAKALYQFFSGFGLPAFTENTVPDDQDLPYITYSLVEPEWNAKATLYAQVWYRTHNNAVVNAKADEITAAIGTGIILPCDGGYCVLWPETPLVQMIVDGDVRRAYINLSVNAYHMPGV